MFADNSPYSVSHPRCDADGFDGCSYDRYASESVFLMVNYIWSKGDDTPGVYAVDSSTESYEATYSLRKKIAESNLSSILPSLIRSFLVEGIAFYAVRKNGVSVYSPKHVRCARDECGEISVLSVEDCMTVDELNRELERSRFPETALAYDREFNANSHAERAFKVDIVRHLSENPAYFERVLTNPFFLNNVKYPDGNKWYSLITWKNMPIKLKAYSYKPIHWVEYPLRDDSGNPIKPGREASVLSKRLEHAKYLLHESVHMTSRPPLLVINDSTTQMGEIDTYPDGLTVIDAGLGGAATGDIRKLYDLTNASQVLMAYVQYLEASVREAYGLAGLNPPASGVMEENVSAQSARYMRMKTISDVLRKEILDPILYTMGNIDREAYEIKYRAAAESDYGFGKMQRYNALISMAFNLSNIDPTVSDVLDPEEILKDVAGSLGISDENFRTDQQVAAIREMRRMAAMAAASEE